MKLRKSLEPALSRELTHGGGFQKDAIVLPMCKARGVHWPVIPVSQSQEPSEASAALPWALGKGVSSLLPRGSQCQGGLDSTRMGTSLPRP